MKLLHLDSSILGENSVSRAVSAAVVRQRSGNDLWPDLVAVIGKDNPAGLALPWPQAPTDSSWKYIPTRLRLCRMESSRWISAIFAA